MLVIDLTAAHPDQKVEWARGFLKPVEGSPLGAHYIERMEVWRGDRRVAIDRDLGPVALHPTWQPFNFWAGAEYSLGECREIAERLRNNKPPEMYERIDMAQSYLRLCEERQKRQKGLSPIGAHHHKQRER